MALQNPGFWLVDMRSVKCVSGPWSVFSRIRTGFSYVNLTCRLEFETFLHVYKVVMWRKSILGSILRSLGNINKYLHQHKFHRKS
jgi:hypothetical protein